MMNGCQCGWWMVGYGLIWWVLASGLLYYSWNKVIVQVLPVREAKWWYAFLIVLTAVVLCWPCQQGRQGCCGKKNMPAMMQHSDDMQAPGGAEEEE